MRMKDLAKAFATGDETKLVQKIDKEIERLIQLRFVAKIVSAVKELHYDIVPKYIDKNFKCTIESLHTFPASWGLIYNVNGIKGKLQIDEYNLELLATGFESIRDNKLIDLASTGITVEHNFEEKLIYMLVGSTVFNEYFEHALETEMHML